MLAHSSAQGYLVIIFCALGGLGKSGEGGAKERARVGFTELNL